MTAKPLRILIVDENPTRATILEEGLRDRDLDPDGDPQTAFVVDHLRETTNLLPRIAAIAPDVIVIDLGTPSREALEQTFQVARAAKRPIAMFVDHSDAATVQAAIDAGVAAYIVDGLKKERVRAVIDVTISRFHWLDRLQTELQQARSALEERRLVDQAKAILMRERGLTEDAAYGLLRRTAMNENRKIADLARALITAASLLAGGEPAAER